jgi:serine/threonine-protein kinase
VYALSVVLWEVLSGRRLFTAEDEHEIARAVKAGIRTPPSACNPEVSPALDAIVMRGCALHPEQRFATAQDMADALLHAAPCAVARTVGLFVESIAAGSLSQRKLQVAEVESAPSEVGRLGAPSREPASVPEPSPATRPGGPFAPAAATVAQPAAARSATPVAPLPQKVRRLPVQPGPAPGPEEGPATAATWTTSAPSRLSAPLLGVLAGVLLAFVLGLVLLVIRLASPAPEEPAAEAIGPTALPEPAAPTGATVTAQPLPTPAATETEVAEPDTPPAEPSATSRPATTATSKPTATTTAKPTAKKPNCDQPTYRNKNGDLKFRVECLEK